jgi:hypothetical protein
MITLVRNIKDDAADEIEKRFRDLSLAFDTEIREDHIRPYIVDGSDKIKGEENLNKWFMELEQELRTQRMISGDACYIDPETGSVC